MSRLNDLPAELIDRSKRSEFIKYVKELPIEDELKVQLYIDWSNEINAATSDDDIELLIGKSESDDGAQE
jgi:hypothetical protein